MSREQTSLSSVYRLGPKLKFVDDFSAIIALYFGADTTLTALAWGSIRLTLAHAFSATDSLQDIMNMLEELSLTLPRLKVYEKSLPMDRALETALLDVYTEVICFYARSIHFFRINPHVLLRQGAWEKFQFDFARTIRRIKTMSAIVESEADLARMRVEDVKYKEVLELMDDLKKTKIHDENAIRCHHIPSELNSRFWAREQALKAIDAVLKPDHRANTLRSFALYGMGGVGKTQIALQYANRNREHFNVILWIAADSTIRIGQSFIDIVKCIGLVTNDEDIQDTVTATLKVKSWLASSSKFQISSY